MRRRIDIRIPFTDFSFIMISVFMILISMGYFEGKVGEKFFSESEVIKKGKKVEKSKIKELYKIDNKKISSREKVVVNEVLNETKLKQEIIYDKELLLKQEKAEINYNKSVEGNKGSKKEDIKETVEKIEENKKCNFQVFEEELGKHDYIDLR